MCKRRFRHRETDRAMRSMFGHREIDRAVKGGEKGRGRGKGGGRGEGEGGGGERVEERGRRRSGRGGFDRRKG